ncbi:MAG TPA: glycosyl hydrolase [Verrucomicrobiae bacterium]|nr:glycosyl hydrolase [Verrucomicrobiae bacterium]
MRRIAGLFAGAGMLLSLAVVSAADLESGFANPPREARTRAYWWWLNGNVDKAAITRDLEEMKAKGWGGALICDAGGAEQDGNDRVPAGPAFFSTEWRELYRHTLKEANRLELELSLNIQSGWNLGGPDVLAEDSAKKVIWSELEITGPTNFSGALPLPRVRDNYSREIAVLAYRIRPEVPTNRPPLKHWREKAIHNELHFSAPETAILHEENQGLPNEHDARVEDVVDLRGRFGADGILRWEVPAGRWQVLRFVCTIGDRSYVSTSSDGWKGYSLDVLDQEALKKYWDSVVEPLIADAGSFAGSTLKYLHTDSWEVEPLNWTLKFPRKFLQYRGYDVTPWLPVLAGRIINSREDSNRFLHDFRRTLGDLAVAEHYTPFRDWAHRHGILIHPESGGPHAVPIDAQQCLGMNDVPMSEFWAWSWRHRVGDRNRFFLKQPASAAHTYGRRLVAAEGFTTIGPHWQETVWDNLRPSFDHALTEGMNRLVWHAFVCSPESAGMPGQQYFAGTHFNPNTTWWNQSGPFIQYMNRCQFMLQQGLFIADALYYYGDHVPNFTQLRSSDPAKVGKGYDYDVITEEAILTRVSVKDGLLILPDGMSYRLMVLPEREVISLRVLEKVRELVNDGATIIMVRPSRASGLAGHEKADARVREIAAELLGREPAAAAQSVRRFGKGRVVSGRTAREVLQADGVVPDFEAAAPNADAEINYIHRRDGRTDFYFVANRSTNAEEVSLTFRIGDRAPELWDAVTGERRFAADYQQSQGRTIIPVQLPPCGSMFVVFRENASAPPAARSRNYDEYSPVHEIAGSWTVAFDSRWGGPGTVTFDDLVSWPERPESGVRFYSGTATYRRQFTLPEDEVTSGQGDLYLDLGDVREMAEVKVNGKSCGIAWTPPFRVNIAGAVRAGVNELQIEVVNFWPNRIIGDSSLPRNERLTRTNVRKFTPQSALMRSGLFGPVKVVRRDAAGGPRVSLSTENFNEHMR